MQSRVVMPLCGRYICGGVSVVVWKIEETVECLQALLSSPEAGEVARFSSLERRREWLAVRLLLARLCGVDARIVYDAAGKPSLARGGSYISISHTDGYAAVALSADYPVGLDVELSTRVVGGVYRRFMREEELDGVPRELCNAAKLIRWTASEALFKLTGNLGGNFRDNIVLEKTIPAREGVFSLSLAGLPEAGDEYSLSYLFDGDLLLALATSGKNAPFLRPADGL